MKAHVEQIQRINPALNAAVAVMFEEALEQSRAADKKLASGESLGPLHGIPFSVKDSIDVQGVRTTAGTIGRKNCAVADKDATVVARLRKAGAIPVAKTNLPDLLFAYETDNLIFGRTNNPYDLNLTPGGSSGGEAALIAACGSPLGLGSDAAGSVRLPAAFCGIAAIKPTSGRLPRTGHVPPSGGWIEALWQIGPMARYQEDLVLAIQILSGEDGSDFTAPPMPLLEESGGAKLRVAFFTDNGFAKPVSAIRLAVEHCAATLSRSGFRVEESRPPGMELAYELEMSLLGADGGCGIDEYLRQIGSMQTHTLLEDGFVNRMRRYRGSAADLAARWAQWDQYRSDLHRFFQTYDAMLCPVYTEPALRHGESVLPGKFEGFSYTMAWNVAG
ncbi:MAG: amidase, partial [Acidobacteriaceae bacterium]|nr:amidase [Acidobacteriaceae bacterium]